MKLRSIFIAVCVAAAIAASGVTAESPEASPSPVLGEVVDADVPAMYRLPLVREAARETPGKPRAGSPLFGAPVGPVSRIEPAEPTPEPSLEARGGDRTPVGVGGRDPIVGEAKPPAETALAIDKRAGRTSPRSAELTTQLLPAVQRGFGLAQRGALYAARTEFVQVLRRVAQARDAAGDTSDHSRALAAGLRALDEAEDFVPAGVQLEAELDVRTTASSHRTNVLPERAEDVSPSEAVALYHEFAQAQLKKAVVDEQAGSMALYGLGTIYARLASRKDDDVELTRNAITMYAAALDACPNNHLAANELGVLVCRSGRANEAASLFKQAINFAPTAVAYHNLAIAQQRSGLAAQAAANELESQRLAAMERARGDVSRRAGVHWVTPEEMARASRPIQRAPAMPIQQPAMAPQQAPPAKSAWQRVVDSTRAIPIPGRDAKEDLGPMPAERVARPSMTGAGNQSQWR